MAVTTSVDLSAAGDGVLQWLEACDDGNQSSGDGCDARCQVEGCGDGLQEAHEPCDDGNGNPLDGCHLCRLSSCGDGYVREDLDASHPDFEECDDGDDTDPSDGCHQCLLPRCGDGIYQPGLSSRYTDELGVMTEVFEQCDGGAECNERCESATPCSITGDCPEIDWIYIEGGAFELEVNGEMRSITIPSFEMSRTEVTVAQWRACVEAGVCTSWFRNSNYVAGREDHPKEWVWWREARAFAHWVGGDLPSYTQWYFAATSRAQYSALPSQLEVCEIGDIQRSTDDVSCHGRGTSPVCAFPRSNTDQGLCDMVGNAKEYLLGDLSFTEVNEDGSPSCENDLVTKSKRIVHSSTCRLIKGSVSYCKLSSCLRAQVGIRLVRSPKEWTMSQAPGPFQRGSLMDEMTRAALRTDSRELVSFQQSKGAENQFRGRLQTFYDLIHPLMRRRLAAVNSLSLRSCFTESSSISLLAEALRVTREVVQASGRAFLSLEI